MADVTRSVEINVKVIGDAADKLSGLNVLLGDFKKVIDGLAGNTTTVATGVGTLANAIHPLSTFNPKGVQALQEALEPLAKVDGTKLATLGTALSGISTFTAPKGFTAFVNSLVTLSSVSKFPSFAGLGNFLVKVSTIDKMPPIGAFVKNLQVLATIDKFPPLATLATALTSLGQIPKLPALGTFTRGLKDFATIEKFPSMTAFATSLKKLSEVGTLPIIPQGMGKALAEFGNIGKLPALKAFAGGLKEMSGIANLPTIPEALGKAIKGFEGIGKLPALKAFAGGLKEMAGINNLPIIPEALGKSIKGFEGIGKLPALKAFSVGLKKLSEVGGALPTIPEGFVTAIEKFSRIKTGDLPKLTTFAKGLKALKEAASGGINKLEDFYKVIKNFSSIDKVPNVSKITKALQGLSEIKMPDFTKVITGVEKLAAAFKKLETSAPIVTALIRIGNAAETVEKNMNVLTKTVKQTANGFQELGKRLKNYVMYRIIADSVILIKEAFTGSIDAIVEYDQALKNLQAIMQTTDAEARAMGVAIEGVASSTKFSATEVAEGMQILGQSGLSATEAINTIQATADLATGTLTDMSTSVDLLTTALRVFDIATEDSAHVADVFANAVNGSKLTIDKLRTAMNYVGPIAASAGVSLEETAASMMTLANSGQRASTIGTGLRRMFAELIDPSEKMKKAAEEVGISLEQLDPTANDLSDVIRDLGVVITDADVAFDLFGKRGAAAALSLTKDVAGGFDSMLESVGRFGTASAMADTQMEGLGVSFKNLQDKIKLIAIALGKAGMIDALKIVVDMLRELADSAVWLIDNGLKPIMALLKPLVALFAKLPAVLQVTALGFGAIALNMGGVVTAFSTLMKLNIVSKLTAAASAAWTLNTATTASTASVSAFSAASIASAGSTGILTGAIAALRAALAALMGPVGWAITGVVALVGAFAILHESSDEQIEDFETLRTELEQTSTLINTYVKAIASLAANGINIGTIEGQKELGDFMNKMAKDFPELAAKIRNTKGDLSELNAVMAEHQKALDEKMYQSALKGLDGYADKLISARGDIKRTHGLIAEMFNTDNELSDKRAAAEADFATYLENISQIVVQANKRGDTIDWAKMFGVTADLMQDGGVFAELRDTILASVKDIEEGLGEVNISDKFQLYGIAAQWKAEFDASGDEVKKFGSQLQNFIDGNITHNERFAVMLEGIDKKKIAGYIQRQHNLVAEMEKADKELTGEDRLKAMRDIAQKGVELNAEIAADEDAQRVIGYANLVKWNDKKVAEIEASNQTVAAKDADHLALLIEGQKKRKKIMASGLDSGAMIKAYSENAKNELAAFKAGQEQLKQEAEKSGVDRAGIEQKITDNATQFYNEQYLAAQVMYNKIKNDGKFTTDDIQKAQDKLQAAKVKSEEAQTASVKKETDLRIAEQKREYTKRKEEIETGSAALIASIEAQEAAGTLTYKEAEKAKVTATLDRYRQIAQLAKKYRDEEVEGTIEWEKYNNRMLNADEQYYNKKASIVESHNNKVNELNKQIIAGEKKIVAENEKNASTIEKNQDKLAVKLKKIWRESGDDRVDATVDLTNKIEDIEHDLAKKLEDIEDDLNKKRETYADKRLEREKKLKSTIEGIGENTQDSLDKVGQRGMSDAQKARNNAAIAERKYREAIKLRQTAERTGNAELLSDSDSLLSSANSLAEGFKSAGKAKKLITDVGAAKIANALLEKEIKDLEAVKELNKEIAESKKKRQDAIEETDHKIELAQRAHDDKMTKLVRENKQAVDDAKATHQLVMSNEDERHRIKMANLLDEQSMKKEELAFNKDIAQSVSTGGDDVTAPIEDYEKVTEAVKETEKQHTLTSSVIQKQQKEIAENGYRVIEENGKKVYTNLTDGQRAFTTAFAEGMQTAGGSIKGIGEQGKLEIKQVTDELGRIKEITAGENTIKFTTPQVPNLRKQIPEVLPVEIRVEETINKARSGIANLQKQIASIGDEGNGLQIIGPEQLAEIEQLSKKLGVVFAGLSTDDPKQKLQDMVTTLKGMGAISKVEFDHMAGQVREYASTVDGVNVNLSYGFDGMNAKLKESAGLVDVNGVAIEGLSDKIQSNSFELFDVGSFKTISAGIEGIGGVMDSIREKSEARIQLEVDTQKAEDAINALVGDDKHEVLINAIVGDIEGNEQLDSLTADKEVKIIPVVPDVTTDVMEPIPTPIEPFVPIDLDLEQEFADQSVPVSVEPVIDDNATNAIVSDVSVIIKEGVESNDVKVPIVFTGVFNAELPLSETLTMVRDSISGLSELQPTVSVLLDTSDLLKFKNTLAAFTNEKIDVLVNLLGTEDISALREWTDTDSDEVVEIKASVDGMEELNTLYTLIESIVDKFVTVTAAVIGLTDVHDLYDAIDKLEDKVVTVTTKFVTTGKEYAMGGLVQKFADGGSVFPRLANSLISKGSGLKDDVAAMLSKGEFVHTARSVSHYGVDFMRAINSMTLPKPSYFASGGMVGGTSSDTASRLPNDIVNLSLDFPTDGPPIDMQLDSFQLDELISQINNRNRMAS